MAYRKNIKKNTLNLGDFIKGVQANENTAPSKFLKNCSYVDLNDKLGEVKEGFHRGILQYTSEINFDPKLIKNIISEYGAQSDFRLKTLKDNFTRLEQVIFAPRTIEKKMQKTRESMDAD